MVTFPQVSPPKPCICLSSPPFTIYVFDLQTFKDSVVRHFGRPLVQKSRMLLSPCLITDATGWFHTTVEVHSFLACHISHGLYSIAVACSIFIPSHSFRLAFHHELRTMFYLSFTHFHFISSEEVFLVIDILQLTWYVHHMLVTVQCLTFKILSIEVLATTRCNILHNLNFQLTLF